MGQWREIIGREQVTGADIIKKAIEMTGGDSCYGGDTRPEFKHPDFREALLAVAGRNGAINSRSLGEWIRSQAESRIEGFRFVETGSRQGVALFALWPD